MGSLIKNRNRVKQVIDFTGVQNGAMHPSDIDAVLEFDNKVLILMEIKYKSKPIPTGQRLMLERICDSWHNEGRSIVLRVEHQHQDENTNIPLDDCTVSSYYHRNKWVVLEKKVPFIEYLNAIGNKWECKKCKF